MERYRRIYNEMVSLLRFSRTIDPKLFGYEMAFISKMSSLETMYREALKRSKELEEVAKEEQAEGKVLLNGTTKALYRAIAYFEASLNAFYSLLQVIAKVTPYFYEKEESEQLRRIGKGWGDNFGKLVRFFKDNTSIDPEFSSYVATKLKWYETLRNNRHMITHEGSAFLGFKGDGKIVFIDYPKKKFSWFGQNKQTKELENYLNQSFNDLFDFLDFYANHFSPRLKST